MLEDEYSQWLSLSCGCVFNGEVSVSVVGPQARSALRVLGTDGARSL